MLLIYHDYKKIKPNDDEKELQKKRIYKVTNTYYVVSLILTFSLYVVLKIDSNYKGPITKGLNEIWILIISFVISNLFLFCIRTVLLCKKSNLPLLKNVLTKTFAKKWDNKLDKTAKWYVEYVTNFLFSITLSATLSFGMYSAFLVLFKPDELKNFLPPTNLNVNLLVLLFTMAIIFLVSYLTSYIFALISEYILLKCEVHSSCIIDQM